MKNLEAIYGDALNTLRANRYTDAELSSENIIEAWRIKHTLRKGDEITYCGYNGTITDMIDWCVGSVEIRLRSGVTCVSVHDLKKVG